MLFCTPELSLVVDLVVAGLGLALRFDVVLFFLDIAINYNLRPDVPFLVIDSVSCEFKYPDMAGNWTWTLHGPLGGMPQTIYTIIAERSSLSANPRKLKWRSLIGTWHTYTARSSR